MANEQWLRTLLLRLGSTPPCSETGRMARPRPPCGMPVELRYGAIDS